MRQFTDKEELLKAIRDILVENINDCIDTINADKADNIVLDNIPVADQATIDKYFWFFLTEDPNKRPLVNIFIESIDLNENQTQSAETVTVRIDLFDTNKNKNNGYLRSLRYQKALKNAIQKSSIEFAQRAELSEVEPQPFLDKFNKVLDWQSTIKLTLILV